MKLGVVIGTFSAKKGIKITPRPEVRLLKLIENYGIKDDKFANADIDKTVMIVGLRSYERVEERNIILKKGSYGENILVDFDPHDFDIGAIFQLGNALIKTTGRCTVCGELSKINPLLPELIKGRRGLYCKIIKSGIVEKNVEVILKKSQ